MDSKDHKLTKVGAKRFGHRSHVRLDGFVRQLDKSGFFVQAEQHEKRKYLKKV
jgi:hypothetical protein